MNLALSSSTVKADLSPLCMWKVTTISFGLKGSDICWKQSDQALLHSWGRVDQFDKLALVEFFAIPNDIGPRCLKQTQLLQLIDNATRHVEATGAIRHEHEVPLALLERVDDLVLYDLAADGLTDLLPSLFRVNDDLPSKLDAGGGEEDRGIATRRHELRVARIGAELLFAVVQEQDAGVGLLGKGSAGSIFSEGRTYR